MSRYERDGVNEYDKLIRLQKIVEDADFLQALALLVGMDAAEQNFDEKSFNLATGLLADVADRYGASPEEIDTALQLRRVAST